MSRVITFSRVFPSHHPKKGKPTYFVEKIYASLGYDVSDEERRFNPRLSLDRFSAKYHTIRLGKRWQVGDKFSPRVWSGSPYKSKQITIAPDITIKKIWDFEVLKDGYIVSKQRKRIKDLFLTPTKITLEQLSAISQNDGLSAEDLELWFKKPCKCQIICWNENIYY